MRQPVLVPALTFAMLAALSWAGGAPAAEAMSLSSPQIADGRPVPQNQVYGRCRGGNVSPALSWSGAPDGTESFAVTVFDPDAGGDGWWHWIVFAIPADRQGLARGAGDAERGELPDGAMQGTNDFGDVGYGGPCPPAGDRPHRYRFTVWALDTAKPPFGPDATGGTVGPWLKRHALASATLTARYGR